MSGAVVNLLYSNMLQYNMILFFQYTALFLYYSYVPETNDAKTRKHRTESSDKYSLCISCFIIIIMYEELSDMHASEYRTCSFMCGGGGTYIQPGRYIIIHDCQCNAVIILYVKSRNEIK